MTGATDRPPPEVLAGFGLAPSRHRVAPLPGGHIHDSFRVSTSEDDRPVALLQRIATAVFPAPQALSHNLERVTAHLRAGLEVEGADIDRHCLQALVTERGSTLLHHDDRWWRALRWIERSHGYRTPPSTAIAYRAARAFGDFQRRLADLDPATLSELLPGFHDTLARYRTLDRAVEQARADARGRLTTARAELERLAVHRPLAETLAPAANHGELPTRLVHADAKLANVLFDDEDDSVLCVVDLDTVMPGLAPWDFGDLVRSMASDVEEDEPEIDGLEIERERLEAIVVGFLDGGGDRLSGRERARLRDGALVITLEQAVRFLTDFLLGNRYYRVDRPDQNLDRCRVQLALLEALLARPELFPDG